MSRRRQQAGEANELDSLSREQLLNLNAAFNTVFSADDQPSPSKRQRTADPEPPESSAAPGGFFVEDPQPAATAGGFMTNEAPPSISGFPSNLRPPPSHALTNKDTDMIPLTRIPTLLQTLDLPSDGQVLTALETGADSDNEEDESQYKEMVSRRNFLRVCAVLLGNESDSEEGQEEQGSDDQSGSEASFAPSDNDQDDAEDTQGGFQADPPQGQRTTRASRRRRGGPAQDLAMLGDDVEEDEQGVQHIASRQLSPATTNSKKKKDKGKQKAGELSGVQKQRASELFTAFLPEGEEIEDTRTKSWEELSQRTLGFNEIRRVATRVSVSLTDAEINEMLEMASTGSRSALTLGDFVQVMQQIRAV